MATRTDTRNPAEIEHEIRRTQYEMSDTADRLGEQLRPSNLAHKASEKMRGSRDRMVDSASRNAIPLGMIAVGGAWLAAKNSSGLRGNSSGSQQDRSDMEHIAYVEHMSRIEPRADEDHPTYLRRRDCARATFLLIEQRPDEDESSFRRRLDDATERMRERRHRMSEGISHAGSSARDGASHMASSAKSTYQRNPLLGGLAAAFVGAIAGATVPVSRTEEEKMGAMGSHAIDMAKDKAKQAGEKARDKKDEMVDKADEKMSQSGSSSQGSSSGQSTQMRSPQYDPV